jgi:hypothetical protein
LLSILVGIMFPEVLLKWRYGMSPDLVDQTILACCKPKFLKVARVICDAATALGVPVDAYVRGEPMDANISFIAGRVKALAEAERLESQGNLDRPRYSEIRLPEKRKPHESSH